MIRSAILNTLPGASSIFSKEETLEMFRRMCMIRYFELEVKKAYDCGKISMPIYLGLGQEALPAALSVVWKDLNPAIFAQHRAHGWYIAFGGNLEKLRDELLHKPTGCAQGMGGSASIHSPEIRMYGHDGFMGTQVPIGVGYSFANNFNRAKEDYALIVMGDASAEEDYVLGALGYASHKKLPILFVCEDNNLSILTEVKVRRQWKMTDVAKAFCMEGIDLSDDPWSLMYHAKTFKRHLPAFMNVHIARDVWHFGTGSDGPPEWNRFMLVKKELDSLGLTAQAQTIESNVNQEMQQIWKEVNG